MVAFHSDYLLRTCSLHGFQYLYMIPASYLSIRPGVYGDQNYSAVWTMYTQENLCASANGSVIGNNAHGKVCDKTSSPNFVFLLLLYFIWIRKISH